MDNFPLCKRCGKQVISPEDLIVTGYFPPLKTFHSDCLSKFYRDVPLESSFYQYQYILNGKNGKVVFWSSVVAAVLVAVIASIRPASSMPFSYSAFFDIFPLMLVLLAAYPAYLCLEAQKIEKSLREKRG